MSLSEKSCSRISNEVCTFELNIHTTIDSYQIIEGRVSKIGTLLDCINARDFYFDSDDDFQIGYVTYVMYIIPKFNYVKFMFSKKATQIDENIHRRFDIM